MSISFASGMRLTPARLNALVPIEVKKPSDTGPRVNNTQVADPHLVIAIPSTNAVYDIEGHLVGVSAANAAGDIAYSFTYPTGCELTWGAAGPHNSLASGSQADGEWFYVLEDAASPSTTAPYGASIAGAGTLIKCRLEVGDTLGDLTLLWGQQATNASGTTLKAGSYLRMKRVS